MSLLVRPNPLYQQGNWDTDQGWKLLLNFSVRFMIPVTDYFVFNHLIWSKPTAEWPWFRIATVQVFSYKLAMLDPLLSHVYGLGDTMLELWALALSRVRWIRLVKHGVNPTDLFWQVQPDRAGGRLKPPGRAAQTQPWGSWWAGAWARWRLSLQSSAGKADVALALGFQD